LAHLPPPPPLPPFNTINNTDAHPGSKLRFLVTLGATDEAEEDVGDEEMRTPPPDQPNRILLRCVHSMYISDAHTYLAPTF